MATIPDTKINKVVDLYNNKKMSMREISEHFKVSLNSVIYFMKKHKIDRRDFSQANKASFDKKAPSFLVRKNLSANDKEIKAIGAMLYWAEGFKSDRGCMVDFANSDPGMIYMFLNFLRRVYVINEKKLRVYLYCYSDQDIGELIRFWSNLTNIPKEQFSKPYIRNDFRKNGRKMKHGLIHIRYGDKKLLSEILNLISFYKSKYIGNVCVGTQVVNEDAL